MNARNAVSILIVCLALGFAVASPAAAQEEARLLRFPSASATQIVFTSAGDLYTVPVAGGIARKLTGHAGYECFARFSPDGKWIAFTGEYDGNREVYLVPAQGGVPKRLTYTPTLGRDDISDRMGPNNLVMGWTRDAKKIVFRSRMTEWNDFNGQLYLVPAEGGRPEQIPLPRGGFCSFSPGDDKLAYNRIFREFRTWKRYRGGMADDVWIYDFAKKTVENVTDNPALDIIPMWAGDRIYFLSDRDDARRMNLFVYDLKAKTTRRLTSFTEFDVKFPSLGPDAIVFENGGYIYRFDLASEQTAKVPIVIADDRLWERTRLAKVGDQVTNFEIGPDGKRALFGARGDVFTVPAKYGNARNLTRTPGVHERNSKWSPDGRWVAYISDKSGTDEVWVTAADGSAPPRQLTENGDTYKYQILWSPDGTKLLWSDKKLRLQYVDVKTRRVVEVDKAERWEITDYAWSPDSRWIVYARPMTEPMTRIFLYSLTSKERIEATDGWYESNGPAFSSDGKYVVFVSDRDFNPVFSRTEWNHAYRSMSRVYLLALAKATKSPFEPKSDEVAVKKEEPAATAGKSKAKGDKDAKPEAAAVPAVKVDADGIKGRIIALPIEVAGYGQVSAVGDTVYYLKRGDRDTAASLKMYSLTDLKETDLGAVDGYEISTDLKKMLVAKDRSYAIIDLAKTPVKLDEKLDLGGLEVVLDLRREWDQIFDECWRQMKDFFYDPNMHGVDWEALRLRYAPLARAAAHRADLTYVIGELIGELSAGHTYVGGGDLPRVPRLAMGMLGARLERDAATGYYRVARILRGANWNPALRSPLTEVGVDVREGEYLIAVDGTPVNGLSDVQEALVNTAGRQVRLRVNAVPAEKGSREVVVVPTATENALYYEDWVQRTTEKVETATGGLVGYVHIPDMGVGGLNEFVRRFYPQLRKKALIVDVRGNGGGNVSPMVLERLRREMVMIEVARNTTPGPDPADLLVGPKVCLCDEFSASDGDIFPYRFKTMGLGPLIGKRTWGGVVGIRGTLPLLDGGVLNKPEFAPYSKDGKDWVIEGRGVEPDIVVDNDPAREFAGIDDQLDKAIEVILAELKAKGRDLPPAPPFPKKHK
ncbi:MAG: PD40 domain-containing protein [Candidatus Aminicenantes bacterium]|nr:PD40 domain-containing protein [Candidatus Aminicenantes bacterium]